ncbi:hypothetical protein L345_06824, partial [Ophiophagus hannah]
MAEKARKPKTDEPKDISKQYSRSTKFYDVEYYATLQIVSYSTNGRHSLYSVYYKCPCERGLICDADRTIVGSVVNSDFGICKDPSNKINSDKKERKKY